MKRSELKQIIKEEIKLLLEQPIERFKIKPRKNPNAYSLWKELKKVKKFTKKIPIETVINEYEKKLKELGQKGLRQSSYKDTHVIESNKKIKIQFDKHVDGSWQATLLGGRGILGWIKVNA